MRGRIEAFAAVGYYHTNEEQPFARRSVVEAADLSEHAGCDFDSDVPKGLR